MTAEPLLKWHRDTYADTIIAAIRETIAEGQIPVTVASFRNLHDFVDANDYLIEAEVPYGPELGEGHEYDWIIAVSDEVDRRIKAGALWPDGKIPDTGTCCYCQTSQPMADLESFNRAGNLACRDTGNCSARMNRAERTQAAYRIGSVHALAGKPALDVEGDDSAALMTELGETGPTTDANIDDRIAMADAYLDGWHDAAKAAS
ncbi:MAG TPA: hypothetical protein VFQ44_01910 [Streptosporangiaceae bacterium]|nr:hypothetical protein [Streptosporangiaceae bacterium]